MIFRRLINSNAVKNGEFISRVMVRPGARSLCDAGKGPKKSSKKSEKANNEVNNKDNLLYKAPEYYSYNEWTYNDYMVDMKKYRLPQPSNKA